MTAPAKPHTAAPAAVALSIFACFWLLAALILGLNLWQEVPVTLADTSPDVFAANAGAVTVAVLCLLGASICGGAAVIVGQLARGPVDS